MTDRDLMQQALGALEKSLPRLAPYGEQDWLDSKEAIDALRARLAQPEQPKMNRIASLKFSELRADGYVVCGVMIQRQNEDGTMTRGAVSYGGMVVWWHPERPAVRSDDPVNHCESGPDFCPQCHLENRSLALAAAVRYVKNNTPSLVHEEICNALNQ